MGDTQQIIEKPNVVNPRTALCTVGEELGDIFRANGVDEAKMGLRTSLTKKEKLTDNQIKRACRLLNQGESLATYLRNFQKEYERKSKLASAAYKKAKKNYARLKGVLPLLKNEFEDGLDRLDDILDFFGVDSEEEVFAGADSAAALFRKQNNVRVDPVNLKAWLRRGELDFQKMNIGEYDAQALRKWIEGREWQRIIDSADDFLKLPEKLMEFGVALVFVPFIPRTVYGAVRWFDGKPLVQVSDRDKDLATCWFTLFHELGHVLLHHNEEILDGELNDKGGNTRRKEKEANKFANEILFNGDNLRKEVFSRSHDTLSASYLAAKYDVPRLLASYWLIKAQYQPYFQVRKQVDFALFYQ
ncbi:MAG: ImmA/IrrE family metallo-endopeptidase [Bacteroidales bacterium]|nr:ImmA/IrrE family metallo-endopeptidase [Bacteroidales bacterium]